MSLYDMKKIALLGSTGSIGVNALKIILNHPEKYRAVALGAGRNMKLLEEQIEATNPAAVSVLEERDAEVLRKRTTRTGPLKVHSGKKGFIRLATLEGVDTVISAVTGAAGLEPTFEAIKAGKEVALANKETMVMAGRLVMEEAERRRVSILPIDSEHSAILQSLQGHSKADIRRIILTASGGPFRDTPAREMRDITPEMALAHPNWEMGPKITVDSATLMNKGLEAIEAKWFFGLEMDQISILIHPQSVVHSMVEYNDKSIIAQLGLPDMTIPISYALSYPEHIDNALSSLELDQIGALTFARPDFKKFRCLALALEAADIGNSMPAVLNGANETAVEAFLEGRIGFNDIATIIEETMNTHDSYPVDSIESVMEADRWSRKTTQNIIFKRTR